VSFVAGMYSASQVVAVALVFRKRRGREEGRGEKRFFIYLHTVFF